ncbi:DNA internalization-related competence protein ComEC/Rec2 [Rubrivirga sp. S365]|uniref:DNA internalization-related competence protein ComEC/Rec2 n=1 Tax=Rubrivirga litoralis TaxID=3075598 RepID=A0ABU3BLM2_9BACT|nr:MULTISPECIES: DNA internalization-related competence protein ComEC/Rec2 [unclassified Rubrivirga]MDT0630163.1 DNA internalization-related competence protein ComEC/Rec2 [Rubrivirga sp. F394]MDT7855674.1 DNA internalization-related competence protein ComEC/Rec2 [Rubrivirga sp. S365]
MPLAPPPPPLRPSGRPLLVAAVAFGCGIALAHAAPPVGVAAWAGGAAALALAAGAYAWATRGRLVTLRGLVLALAVAGGAVGVGAARLAAWRALPADHVAHLAQAADYADLDRDDRAPVTLWGTVDSVPTGSGWSVRFRLRPDSAARGGAARPVAGPVQVSLLTPDDRRPVYPALRLGDRVRLSGRLATPPRPRNPAQMDYGAYLRGQGIWATLRVDDETGAAFLAPSARWADRVAVAVQRHVRVALARTVPSAEARGVLLALLLADRSRVDGEALDAFRQTGLMHLLAVSGLHVGLVGLALYGLLKPLLGRLGLRHRTVEALRAAVTLAVLAVYVLVTGGSVSVVRAFVMVALVLAGRALERPSDTLNTLGAAALVLLVSRPTALFDVGFQLSFAAVAAIVTLTPLLTAAVSARVRERTVGGAVVGSVAVSLAATVGTAPVLLAHFGRLPLGALVLNLPAIPLTGLTLGSGLAAVATSGWLAPAAAAFGALADLSARALLLTSRVGAGWLDWAALDVYVESPLVLAALALGAAALAVWRRPALRLRLALTAAACLGGAAWAHALSAEARPHLDAVFLDVGQGDATLLALPNGRHVLVDAGLRSPYVDEGERTVLPHLARYGIDRVDALVLTHADADHIGGAAAVMRGVRVDRLVVNGRGGETDLWAKVVRTADSLGVPVQVAAAGDTLALDPAVRLRVLGPAGLRSAPPRPGSGAGSQRPASANEASVVLRVEYGRTRWLLTGDAERGGEAAVVARYGPLLASDVVKVGHHGSRTSSTPALVAAAGRPAFAVVSVARRNRYGLPDEEPIARWGQTGAQTLLTSAEGAVWLRSDGERVWRVAWR